MLFNITNLALLQSTTYHYRGQIFQNSSAVLEMYNKEKLALFKDFLYVATVTVSVGTPIYILIPILPTYFGRI